ncbi:MAG: hypothetical protein QXY39_08690 [Thermofilaceae archaeon]
MVTMVYGQERKDLYSIILKEAFMAHTNHVHTKAIKRLREIFAECTGKEMPEEVAERLAEFMELGIPCKSFIFQEGKGEKLKWFTIQTVVWLTPDEWLLIEIDSASDFMAISANSMNSKTLTEALISRVEEFATNFTVCEELEEFRQFVIVHTPLHELQKMSRTEKRR